MAINFSNEVLGTKILCNQVSTECCEVGNLISRDPVKRSRGFVAESFVRAPVDILLQFPCPVNIFKIVINACVGSQRSTGFELFAQREIPGKWTSGAPIMLTLQKLHLLSAFVDGRPVLSCHILMNQQFACCGTAQQLTYQVLFALILLYKYFLISLLCVIIITAYFFVPSCMMGRSHSHQLPLYVI